MLSILYASNHNNFSDTVCVLGYLSTYRDHFVGERPQLIGVAGPIGHSPVLGTTTADVLCPFAWVEIRGTAPEVDLRPTVVSRRAAIGNGD